MAETLPNLVIIQSNENIRYLCLNTGNPDVPEAVQFGGDYSFERDTRFKVEHAATGNGLIHIQCLQNMKYLANFGTHNNYIAAIADKPEENKSDPRCTLLQPVFLYPDNNRELKLRHVNTGLFVKFCHGDHDHGLLSLKTGDDHNVYTFIDWESVVQLPNLIRIKGHNGNYLKAFRDGYMDFNNKVDNSTLFDFEVSPSRDGGIRLRSIYYNTYWTDMDDSYWVLLMPASTTVHETNTVFIPIRDGNRIMLRCLKNDMFCRDHSDKRKTKCLATIQTFSDDNCYMEIEEPFISRKIVNVIYNFDAARRYDENIYELTSTEAIHGTRNSSLTTELNLKRTVTNTTNWVLGGSVTVGSKTTLTAGKPEVVSIGFEESSEVSKSWDEGHSISETVEVGSVKTFSVDYVVRVKGTLMGTRLKYDIPFSYTVRDVLADGTTKITNRNDGLLTGVNGYDYRYEVVELPIE